MFYFILVETYFLTMWREERSGALALVSVFYILVCCILTNLFWWRHLFLLCVQFERLVETFIFGQEWQDGRWGAGVFCSLYLLCFLHLLYFCVIFRGKWRPFFNTRVTKSQDVRWGAGVFQQKRQQIFVFLCFFCLFLALLGLKVVRNCKKKWTRVTRCKMRSNKGNRLFSRPTQQTQTKWLFQSPN